MIPRCDVTPAVDIDYAALKVPTAYEVINGFAGNREYEPLIDVGWEQARECVQAEARWLDRAAQASTTDEFDAILGSGPETESLDDFDWLFRYLDVGVAGLTLVLSAARYATCYSCRGHPGMAYERMPQVIMATDPERARILAGYAARAGCGVESMEAGLLCTYAASVDCFHALAQRMLAAQAELAALAPPSWFPRVQQYLASDDPDQFEWSDSETG